MIIKILGIDEGVIFSFFRLSRFPIDIRHVWGYIESGERNDGKFSRWRPISYVILRDGGRAAGRGRDEGAEETRCTIVWNSDWFTIVAVVKTKRTESTKEREEGERTRR